MKAPRDVSVKLLVDADEGIISWQQIAEAALRYMSQDQVADMAAKNELLVNFDDEEE